MNKEHISFDIGDIVLVLRGQKTNFYEVIKIEGNYAWITDGWVQVTRPFSDMKLICKAEDRQDKKVPFMKYVE